jgi:RNA polymerase sigma-70 factor (ECF subfamily)
MRMPTTDIDSDANEPASARWTSSEFSRIDAEHSRAIYLTLRLLGDPQQAEDATHDVFPKAFRKMDQFHHQSSTRTWLYRIANLNPGTTGMFIRTPTKQLLILFAW